MTREHRQVLLLGPPSDIRSLLTSRGKPLIAVPGLRRLVRIENPSLVQAQDGIFYSSLCPCFFADYAISSVTARSRRLSVSKASSVLCKIICVLSPQHNKHIYKLGNIISFLQNTCAILSYTQDSCKGGTGVFQ